MKKYFFLKKIILVCCISYTPHLSAEKNIIPNNEQLYSSLLHQTNQYYKERNCQFPTTKAEVQKYQRTCREKYLSIFLDFPKNIQNIQPQCKKSKQIDCHLFSVENIILENRISANLYLPKQQGEKNPAILFLCGHEKEGKATESYQKTAQLLACNGFVVLVPDPIGQGERIQLLDSALRAKVKRSTTEHTLLNTCSLLTGWNIANEELIDNILCINYLYNRFDVDSTQIGCIGNSGGGTQCTYLSAFDKRIKAVACCSWFTSRNRMMELYGPDDGCQYLPSEIKNKLEISDYYIMQAPRPTLILAGTKDFIDYNGTLSSFEELKSIYSILEQKDNIELFSYTDGHGISAPKRMAALRFFLKHLAKKTTSYLNETEAEIKAFSPSDLQCTKTGQISIEFETSSSFQKRMIDMIDNLLSYRASFLLRSTEENQRLIKDLLGINEIQHYSSLKLKQEKDEKGTTTQNYRIKRHHQVDLSFKILSQKKTKENKSIYLLLNDSGMTTIKTKQLTDSLILSGNTVVLADVSGIGSLIDNPSKNNPKFYNTDYRTSALCIMLGKPLVGIQTEDILTLINFLQKKEKQKVRIISIGNIGIAALHAAYLNQTDILSVKRIGGIQSWKEIALHPEQPNILRTIVPHALRWYDIPYLYNTQNATIR